LHFGDPAIESASQDPARPWTWMAVVDFEVDPETDDLGPLVRAVCPRKE
jgi:hypothetical protein